MTMNLLKHVMIRIGSSIIAFFVYIIFFSFIFPNERVVYFETFVANFVFGFFVGYKGIVILPFVSLALDIPLSYVYQRIKLPNFTVLILNACLYLICGALIAFIIYGIDGIMIFSGAIVAFNFHLIFKALWRLNEIEKKA